MDNHHMMIEGLIYLGSAALFVPIQHLLEVFAGPAGLVVCNLFGRADRDDLARSLGARDVRRGRRVHASS